MEQLIALAFLYLEGFDVWDSYLSKLDELYEKYSDNDDELFYLESLTEQKDIIVHTTTLLDPERIDIDSFGKALMTYLYCEYQNSKIDLRLFAEKAYDLWSNLPFEISMKEPFYTLNSAGDALSYGDTQHCREMFEKAFNYYKNKQQFLGEA